MDRTDRILLGVVVLLAAVVFLILISSCRTSRDRIDALEIRLQNIEHLLSVSVSESSPSAFIDPTNRVSASSEEAR